MLTTAIYVITSVHMKVLYSVINEDHFEQQCLLYKIIQILHTRVYIFT